MLFLVEIRPRMKDKKSSILAIPGPIHRQVSLFPFLWKLAMWPL